jgi:hypothetical protein
MVGPIKTSESPDRVKRTPRGILSSFRMGIIP